LDSTIKKTIILIGVIIICIPLLFFGVVPYLVGNEGASYFVFVEVPVNATINSSIIHIEEKDFTNMGMDVKQENGRITRIFFKNSGIHPQDFNDIYGSDLGDPSSRKYLEYRGVYYYASIRIP
jgi:hypothetical protein